MKNFITFILLLISMSTFAQNRHLLEGQLYFGFLREGSLYDQPQEMIDIVTKITDSLRHESTSEEDNELLANYDILKKKKLLYSPYVQLKIEEDSLVYVYLKQSDYDKIKIYKRQDLIDENEKVVIQFKFKRIRKNRLICKKLVSISVEDGETYSRMRKFEIEDYD